MAAIVGNNVSSELAVGINNSVVSLSLIAGGGSLFPDISGTDANGDANYFYATLIDSAQELEVVKCTSVSGDTLTVTRAQEGTGARVFAAGGLIELRLTAAVLNDRYNKAETHAKIVELAPATDITGKVSKGGDTISGDVGFIDNAKATFGDSNDLQIYHEGSGSYITDVGTGSLWVRGQNLALTNADGSKWYLYGGGDSVGLYHGGANKKLATTLTGIDVTGNVAFGDGHTLGNGIGDDNSVDNLELKSSSGKSILIDSEEDVHLRNSGVTKLSTTSTGIDVPGKVEAEELVITGAAPTIKLLDSDAAADDFWLHTNANVFYVLTDRNDDGDFDDSDEWPPVLTLDNGTQSSLLYGNRVTVNIVSNTVPTVAGVGDTWFDPADEILSIATSVGGNVVWIGV